MKSIQSAVLLAMGLAAHIAGNTAVLTPDSYNMPNGSTGSYPYWDETYTGAGSVTTDGALLSGGKGDLTDGVIAGIRWDAAESPAGNGPYVAWTIDPTITFHWNSAVTVQSVTFYLDDANGYGGVYAPTSITVGGTTFAVPDSAGDAPFSFTAGGLSFTGTDLVVSLGRTTVPNDTTWVFLSEVQIQGVSAVPEPATAAMLLTGLWLVGGAAARRRKRQLTASTGDRQSDAGRCGAIGGVSPPANSRLAQAGKKPLYNPHGQERVFPEKTAEGATRLIPAA